MRVGLAPLIAKRWSPVTLRSVPCAAHFALLALRSGDEVGDIGAGFQQHIVDCAGLLRGRHHGMSKAKLCCLLQACRNVSDRANSAGEANLAEEDAMRRQALPGERGDKRRRGGEVGGGFGDAQAAGDIEIDIVLASSVPRGLRARR